MERFRTGQISRGKAVFALTAAIPDSFLGSGAPTESALDAYIDMLYSYDRDIASAAKRGRSFARVDAGESNEEDGDDEDGQGEGEISSREVQRGKRRKIDESKCAWIAEDFIRSSTLKPELERTLDILREFAVDPKAIKASIVNSPSCPGLPDSEWSAIITGRSINLDILLSGLYSTGAEEKLEKIGEIEFKFGSHTPTRCVKTHGEWTIAWAKAVRGILFAFPHRAGELAVYGEYITRLFTAVVPSAHSRVIEFDKAVRKRVGEQRNLLLSDFGEFGDLRTCYIDSFGVSASNHGETKASGSAPSGTKRKKDTCNKFNAGTCTQEAGTCRYRHACGNCKRGGHVASKCTRTTEGA